MPGSNRAYRVGMANLNRLMFAYVLMAFGGPLGLAQVPMGLPDVQAEPTSGDELVDATLISDLASVEPGQVVTLAVRLEITDHWHVYWKNPGDAGMAVGATIQLPKGWEAGPLRWPMPRRFEESGGIVTYGYSDRVLLLADVRVPENAKPGEAVELRAAVEWLVCKDRCLPGEAKIKTSVQVGQRKVGPSSTLIDEWRGRLPAETQPTAIRGIQAAGQAEGEATIALTWTKVAPSDVQWFAHPTPGIIVQGGPATSGKRTTHITLRTHRVGGEEPAKALGVLVTWHDARGERQGFVVNVPLNVGQ